jgi:hypothetical protein
MSSAKNSPREVRRVLRKDFTEEEDFKVEDKFEDKELKSWNLKTNLMGEEGRMDMELAEELLQISQKTHGIFQKVADFNKKNFTKELVDASFFQQFKRVVSKEFVERPLKKQQ